MIKISFPLFIATFFLQGFVIFIRIYSTSGA